MPLPKWPDPVRDNNSSSSSMDSHNNSSSASLNFQPGGDLRSPVKRIKSNSSTPRRSFQRGPPLMPTRKPLDGEDYGRMFMSDKAEVTLLPEEDHLAASAYGDAKLHPTEQKQIVTKEQTSGYDFGEMLKDEDINLSWGNVSSSRW